MSSDLAAVKSGEIRQSKNWGLWVGRVLSAVPILMMLLSASIKLMRVPNAMEMFVGKFGYPESTILGIGLAELACVAVYAIPRTAVLGAILMTGYLGGAIATHVRVSDVFVPPLVLGICAWVGLYLREERLRKLLPLRKPARGGHGKSS